MVDDGTQGSLNIKKKREHDRTHTHTETQTHRRVCVCVTCMYLSPMLDQRIESMLIFYLCYTALPQHDTGPRICSPVN